MGENMEIREQIMQYLEDLGEIATEHANSCKTCWNPETSGQCMLKATITVEIMTYRRKFSETV
jgi:hypothetical protein